MAVFDNKVRECLEYWRDLIAWLGVAATDSDVEIPVVELNGIRSLYFPQTRQAIEERVQQDPQSGELTVTFPDLESTPHVAHQRAAFLKTVRCSKRFVGA